MSCEIIPVIPQNLNTCWFNAIMMSMIYSDGLSQMIYEKAVEDNWHLDENGAFKTLMLLFMNYVKTIKKNGNIGLIERLKAFIDKYKIQTILLDYLTHYDKELLKNYKNLVNIGFIIRYLNDVLKKLGLNVILITSSYFIDYQNIKYDYINNIYIDYKEDNYDISSGHPDILLFNYISNDLSQLGYPSLSDEDIKDKGKEIMTFKGVKYRLDCILLIDANLKHVILGLTCNGSKCVYNGWLKKQKNPCNLMLYDWISNIGNFCLDFINCKLSANLKDSDLCYNFKQNERLMVYVKETKKPLLSKKQVRKINAINIPEDMKDKQNIRKILDTKRINDKIVDTMKSLSSINSKKSYKDIVKKATKRKIVKVLTETYGVETEIAKKTKKELEKELLIEQNYDLLLKLIIEFFGGKNAFVLERIEELLKSVDFNETHFKKISELLGNETITNKESLILFLNK